MILVCARVCVSLCVSVCVRHALSAAVEWCHLCNGTLALSGWALSRSTSIHRLWSASSGQIIARTRSLWCDVRLLQSVTALLWFVAASSPCFHTYRFLQDRGEMNLYYRNLYLFFLWDLQHVHPYGSITRLNVWGCDRLCEKTIIWGEVQGKDWNRNEGVSEKNERGWVNKRERERGGRVRGGGTLKLADFLNDNIYSRRSSVS